ncbi:MAG: hypothetical protein B7C24_05385 [Bacteroidetes bacterium 4572_77]|nr:MAG: hypothetical protein B7C24_05385 [Bacteroidetes bacterium 4572_77]
MGKQFVLGKFLMEMHWGLGLAFHHVTHYDRQQKMDKHYSSLYGYLNKEGDYLRFNIPANFKIGYRF